MHSTKEQWGKHLEGKTELTLRRNIHSELWKRNLNWSIINMQSIPIKTHKKATRQTFWWIIFLIKDWNGKNNSPNWGPPNHHPTLCSSVKRRLHFHLYPTNDKTDPRKLRHLAKDTWWVAKLPKFTILSAVHKAQNKSSVFGSSRTCMSSPWPWFCSNTQLNMASQWQGRRGLWWALISALPAVLLRLFLATEVASGPIPACMQRYSVLETSIANAIHMSSPCFQV